MTIQRAKLLFLITGIYGLAVVVPLFFLKNKSVNSIRRPFLTRIFTMDLLG